jgi:phage terminase small subunit
VPLREKHARFAEEYLVDLNATQAALRAGYSAKTAGSLGHRLLKNVDIQQAITAAQAARSQRTAITQEQVVQALADIGFSPVAPVASKVSALRILAQHLGMLGQKHAPTGPQSEPLQIVVVDYANAVDPV